MTEKKLTSSLEDYIEIIFNKIQKNNSVKAVEIARELNVSRASVTEALNKLKNERLINYGRYEPISLTLKGVSKAQEIFKKHRVLEEFFSEIIGLDSEEAAQNACRIEHVISEKAFENLEKFIINYTKK